jgi:hypothetical protein
MKYRGCLLFTLVGVLLPFSTFAHAQAWSGVLSPSRGTSWSSAGLPTYTWPDGETAANPWTPPARTQCGSTLSPLGSGQDDGPQIVTALSKCTSGHYVLLGSGTFTINSQVRMTPAYMGNVNYVTLRGSGAMNTILKVTYTGGGPALGIGNEVCCTQDTVNDVSTNFAQGNTTITVTGSEPPVNSLAVLIQCDTGLSGTSCGTGTEADNGGIWICANFTVCSNQSASGSSGNYEQQRVWITNVTGSGTNWTVTFTPGLYMPNWGTNVNISGIGGTPYPTPTLNWPTAAYEAYGDGIEDLTIDLTAGDSYVNPNGAWASWIKGVRFVGPGSGSSTCCTVQVANVENFLLFNNYFFDANTSGVGAGLILNHNHDSAFLRLNNIYTAQGAINATEATGADEGDVFAYEFARDGDTTQVYNCDAEHYGGSLFLLREGQQFGCSEDDFTWGTHDFNTWFRNDIAGYDSPYSGEAAPRGIVIDNFSRFENAIGNVIGASGKLTSYSTGSGISPYIFGCNGSTCSTLTIPTTLYWGNYAYGCSGDAHCNTVSFNSLDNPSALAGLNSALDNLLLPSTSLPCSFFLTGYTSPICTPHANGGTGLSWWKVCTNFNASAGTCGGSTQTQPFPPIGPDVTGGPYANGYAYDVPAAVAWKTLPVDTNYQVSYTVTGSSWSAGTETLTVSGFPTGHATMGGFQVLGMSAACYPSSGVSYTGRSDNEMLMTLATSTSVSYALSANPGVSCTGTLKWPDVRQFDERVYESDSGVQPSAPSGANANPVAIP